MRRELKHIPGAQELAALSVFALGEPPFQLFLGHEDKHLLAATNQLRPFCLSGIQQ